MNDSKQRCRRLVTTTVILLGSVQFASAAELDVSTDFPGGSGVVEEIDPQKAFIRLSPTPHKDRGWACWWYVKLSGITPGQTITLNVGDAPWATPDRAAFSTDHKTWNQTAPGKRQGRRITYRHKVDARQCYFAWGPPFVPSDAKRLVEQAARSPHAVAFTLCESNGGRPVPALKVEEKTDGQPPPHGVWIQARQHAWESGSSWVCRGLVEWIVSDDPRAEALRRKATIFVVPIMDVDNVAIGAGGKNQRPHDHNRDWGEEPHFASVRAAIGHIKRLDKEGRFDLFVDLHNPGAGSRHPFYFVTPRKLLSEVGRKNLGRFLQISKLEMTGPLVFRGQTRESGAGYDKRWKFISKNWVSRSTKSGVVAVTLETAWNTPHSTTDGYRRLGGQLGMTIERYLRTTSEPPQ